MPATTRSQTGGRAPYVGDIVREILNEAARRRENEAMASNDVGAGIPNDVVIMNAENVDPNQRRNVNSGMQHSGMNTVGGRDEIMVFKKDGVKVKPLTTLAPVAVRTFLHQVDVAEKNGQRISIAAHIEGEALDTLVVRCPNTGDNEAVKSILNKIKDKEMEKARTKPMDLIRSGLAWSNARDKSNDEKCQQFFEKLEVSLHFINAEVNMPIGTLTRERFMEAVVQKLPTGLLIPPKQVEYNQHLQTYDGLKDLVENRLPLLDQGVNRGRLNRVEEGNGQRQFGEEQQAIPRFGQEITYGINKVQQAVVNRQAEIPRPNPPPPRHAPRGQTYAQATNQQHVPQAPAPRGPLQNIPVMRPTGPVRTFGQQAAQNAGPPLTGNQYAQMGNGQGMGLNQPQDMQNGQDYFPGICWKCNERGHRASQCPLPKNDLFFENLRMFHERKAQLMNLNSDQKKECQLEICTPAGAWVQVAGCMDSGADGNVAPMSAMDHATQVRTLAYQATYRLPNDERIQPTYQGLLNVRVQIEGQPISFGHIPFHFIDHPNWTQVLVGRNTLRRMNVLPEQTFMNRLAYSANMAGQQ